jgi:hypothetical protein
LDANVGDEPSLDISIDGLYVDPEKSFEILSGEDFREFGGLCLAHRLFFGTYGHVELTSPFASNLEAHLQVWVAVIPSNRLFLPIEAYPLSTGFFVRSES